MLPGLQTLCRVIVHHPTHGKDQWGERDVAVRELLALVGCLCRQELPDIGVTFFRRFSWLNVGRNVGLDRILSCQRDNGDIVLLVGHSRGFGTGDQEVVSAVGVRDVRFYCDFNALDGLKSPFDGVFDLFVTSHEPGSALLADFGVSGRVEYAAQ